MVEIDIVNDPETSLGCILVFKELTGDIFESGDADADADADGDGDGDATIEVLAFTGFNQIYYIIGLPLC